MLKFLGLRSTETKMARNQPLKRLSRFETEHSRSPSIPKRPQPPVAAPAPPPARAQLEAPTARLRSLSSDVDDGLDSQDALHSEAGLSPNILRSALPQRFQQIDNQKLALLGHDFFELATSQS